MPILINNKLFIPDSDFEEQFIRSSGPGGQNVNKVSSAVELRFDLKRNSSLRPELKTRLASHAKNKINDEGILILVSKESRSQEENRRLVREKLISLIKEVLSPPKKRIKTKPTKASKERRLSSKKLQGLKKKIRREDY